MFLVDMGSLTNFGDMIREETGINIKTVDMTSTLLVVEAGRKALNGRGLKEIYKSCLEISRYGIQGLRVSNETKTSAIITACFTGEGSAEKLRQILNSRLINSDKVTIIPLNILDRSDFAEKVDELRKTYNILGIVGTVSLNLDKIEFIPAPDILAGDGIEKLDELIYQEEDFIKISKSIDTQLADIDGIVLVSLVREAIDEIQERLDIRISHEVKVGIVIHLCFLIEKTISGGKGRNFEKLNEYRNTHGKEFILVKQSLRKLEMNYNVNIGEDELAFIVRMVTENNESV